MTTQADMLAEALGKIAQENGPVVVDQYGEGLAWRPLDYGSWTPLAVATHEAANPAAGEERIYMRKELDARFWWKPGPTDPFWVLENSDGDYIKSRESCLTTIDINKALVFPSEWHADVTRRSLHGTNWISFKPVEHTYVGEPMEASTHEATRNAPVTVETHIKDFRWRAQQCRTNPDAIDATAAAVWDFAADALEQKA